MRPPIGGWLWAEGDNTFVNFKGAKIKTDPGICNAAVALWFRKIVKRGGDVPRGRDVEIKGLRFRTRASKMQDAYLTEYLQAADKLTKLSDEGFARVGTRISRKMYAKLGLSFSSPWTGDSTGFVEWLDDAKDGAMYAVSVFAHMTGIYWPDDSHIAYFYDPNFGVYRFAQADLFSNLVSAHLDQYHDAKHQEISVHEVSQL